MIPLHDSLRQGALVIRLQMIACKRLPFGPPASLPHLVIVSLLNFVAGMAIVMHYAD
jgi:hypothetical protein